MQHRFCAARVEHMGTVSQRSTVILQCLGHAGHQIDLSRTRYPSVPRPFSILHFELLLFVVLLTALSLYHSVPEHKDCFYINIESKRYLIFGTHFGTQWYISSDYWLFGMAGPYSLLKLCRTAAVQYRHNTLGQLDHEQWFRRLRVYT